MFDVHKFDITQIHTDEPKQHDPIKKFLYLCPNTQSLYSLQSQWILLYLELLPRTSCYGACTMIAWHRGGQKGQRSIQLLPIKLALWQEEGGEGQWLAIIGFGAVCECWLTRCRDRKPGRSTKGWLHRILQGNEATLKQETCGGNLWTGSI